MASVHSSSTKRNSFSSILRSMTKGERMKENIRREGIRYIIISAPLITPVSSRDAEVFS